MQIEEYLRRLVAMPADFQTSLSKRHSLGRTVSLGAAAAAVSWRTQKSDMSTGGGLGTKYSTIISYILQYYLMISAII